MLSAASNYQSLLFLSRRLTSTRGTESEQAGTTALHTA
jgi:hypothetical protein